MKRNAQHNIIPEVYKHLLIAFDRLSTYRYLDDSYTFDLFTEEDMRDFFTREGNTKWYYK